jgi:hypothetical protein
MLPTVWLKQHKMVVTLHRYSAAGVAGLGIVNETGVEVQPEAFGGYRVKLQQLNL